VIVARQGAGCLASIWGFHSPGGGRSIEGGEDHDSPLGVGEGVSRGLGGERDTMQCGGWGGGGGACGQAESIVEGTSSGL